MSEFRNKIAREFPCDIKIAENKRLADYTKIRIGGNAELVADITSQNELIKLHRFCTENQIAITILGHGTNIFFADEGIAGIVARLSFDKVKMKTPTIIRAEGGAALGDLTRLAQKHALTGFEFTAGIPGSVGGAVFGNAGAYGRAIGDILNKAKILTRDGFVKWVGNDFFAFSYRDSSLKKNNAVLLEAEFQLQQGAADEIDSRIHEILKQRKRKLPAEDCATAGSYFKNIKDEAGNAIAAAKFLDAVGSKQMRIGGIGIYENHANIVMNIAKGKAADVLKLEKILSKKVLKKFGIRLEREVMYIA